MTWDICPAADVISQPYGCVDYVGEWLVDASVCPSRHFHAGIDLGHSRGGWTIFRTPVCATRAGTVVAIGTTYLGPFAVTVQAGEVFIEHGHLDEASVVLGQQVAVGEQLGLVGTQGSSTAPHLHVEVRTDGARQGNPDRYTIDPLPYLNSSLGGTDPLPIPHTMKRALAKFAGAALRHKWASEAEVETWANFINDDGSGLEELLDRMEKDQGPGITYDQPPAGIAGPPGEKGDKGDKGDVGPPAEFPAAVTITGTLTHPK